MALGSRDAARALAAALERGDAAAAAALYAEEASLVAAAAEVLRGRAQIEEFWRTGIRLGLSRIDLSPLERRRSGDAVEIEIGRYALVLDGDGGARRERGMYVALRLRERDGVWRRALDVFNPEPSG